MHRTPPLSTCAIVPRSQGSCAKFTTVLPDKNASRTTTVLWPAGLLSMYSYRRASYLPVDVAMVP